MFSFNDSSFAVDFPSFPAVEQNHFMGDVESDDEIAIPASPKLPSPNFLGGTDAASSVIFEPPSSEHVLYMFDVKVSKTESFWLFKD